MRRHLLVILLAAAAAGCSGASTNPLAPARAGAALQGAAGGGPSSYDATGPWFGQVFLEGEGRIGEGVHLFSQEPSGSMMAVGSEAPDDPERDHGIYTFKRIGSPNGTIRNYRFSLHMDAQGDNPCGRDLSGTAQLDTSTNTITAASTGTIDNCATVTINFIWVKQ